MGFHDFRFIMANFSLLRHSLNRGLSGQIGRGAAGSVALKITNVGLGFAASVILARVLGARGYGIYAYVISIAYVLAIPAQFGVPKLVVRETAKAQVKEDWGLLRGVWRWSSFVTLGMTFALVLVALIVALLLRGHLSQLQFTTFLWGIVLVPLISFSALRGAALQGLRRVVLGNIPATILRPAVLIVTILVFVFLAGQHINPAEAMVFTVCAAAIGFFASSWWLHQSRPAPLLRNPAPVYHTRLWIGAILPFALTAGMQKINQYTDILMLGIFGSASHVGVYRVAVQNSLLVVFGLQVADMFIAPYFARLYAQSDHQRLQQLVSLSGKAIFILAMPPFIVFAVCGKTLLGMIFGATYKSAYLPLLILTFGQLINSSFGSVGFLLNMTGHERDTLRGIGVAAVSNVIFNAVLIPRYGMNGAAIATALSLVIWNLVLWHAVRRRLGIETFVIANSFRR